MTTLALTRESINAQGGLPLIGTLIEKFSGLRRTFGSDPTRRSDRLSDADILISQLGLLVQGRSLSACPLCPASPSCASGSKRLPRTAP